MSSPGQYRWIDTDSGLRRAAQVSDVGEAIRLGDALEHAITPTLRLRVK